MKKLYIKFLIFLSLLANEAFGRYDSWGGIHLNQTFPTTTAEIQSLPYNIKKEIDYHRTVGHGVYEDTLTFHIEASFNPSFENFEYEKIAFNTIISAPNLQYIVFDISNLTPDQISNITPLIANLQDSFLRIVNYIKFGTKFEYTTDTNLNSAILNFFAGLPNKNAYLHLTGNWTEFVKDFLAQNSVDSQLHSLDFLNVNSISVTPDNGDIFLQLLKPLKSLKALNIDSIILGDCLCPDPKLAKNLLVKKIMNEIGEHPLISYLNMPSNDAGPSGAEALANALDKFDDFVYINVSANRFGDEGAHRFLRSLSRHIHLSHIDISGNLFHSGHADEFVKVLTNKPDIAYLSYSDNFFAVEGSLKISNALKHPLMLQSLQILKFRNNYDILNASERETALADEWGWLFFSDAGKNYFVLSNALNEYFKFSRSYEYLYLDANNLNLTNVYALSKSLIDTNLKYLDLSGNNLSSEYADAVSQILYFSTQMIGINLESNGFNGDDTYTISQALSTFPEFEYLALSNNGFNSQGISVLSKYLSKDRNLKRLYLSNVELSNQDAMNLFTALKFQKNLEVLDVSFNNIERSGVAQLISSLNGKKKFNTLRLLGNKFDCTDLAEFAPTLSFECE